MQHRCQAGLQPIPICRSLLLAACWTVEAHCKKLIPRPSTHRLTILTRLGTPSPLIFMPRGEARHFGAVLARNVRVLGGLVKSRMACPIGLNMAWEALTTPLPSHLLAHPRRSRLNSMSAVSLSCISLLDWRRSRRVRSMLPAPRRREQAL